ncbi:MAG TPA: DUF4038 domain-containing protein [Thermoanaerobaculia bacterium]|nr:DUF4038 domain-containing protein [Thermoanaerobaculia bacterium]
MTRKPIRLIFALTIALLTASVAQAGECPFSGTSYTAPYNNTINLPRCGGTIGKWTPCEVCVVSNGTYSEQQAYTLSYPATGTGLQPRGTFSQNGSNLPPVDGFFDGLVNGKAVFRIRFTPTVSSGTVNYSTISTDAGLTLAGSFTAGPSSSKGFLRRDSSFPRTFIWDSGSRPYLWGQTYYQIVNHARTGNTSLWQPSITNSSNFGMNKFRLLVSPWGGDPRYANADSKAFLKNADGTLDRDRLDVANFQALDKVTSFLNGLGLVADLIVFHDGDATRSPYGTTVQNRRYARYTAARYAAFPTVIWTLSNEYQLVMNATNASWTDLGCLIRGGCNGYGAGADPWIDNGLLRRPLSIHNDVVVNTSYPCFEFFTAGWANHIALQTRRNPNADSEAFNAVSKNGNPANPNKCAGLTSSTRLPVIDDEYYYLGTDPNAANDRLRHRQAVWAISAAGGAGSTGSSKGPAGCGGVCAPSLYTTWVEEPGGYGDILTARNFFKGLASWWRMVNDTTIPAQSRVYALSDPGVKFVVYSAQGSTVTLNVPAPPAGRQWSYVFINPETGAATAAQLTGGGTRTFTAPSARDWAMKFDVF